MDPRRHRQPPETSDKALGASASGTGGCLNSLGAVSGAAHREMPEAVCAHFSDINSCLDNGAAAYGALGVSSGRPGGRCPQGRLPILPSFQGAGNR